MTAGTSKKRIVSGMRPTGNMHLGNYEGALKNWVRLQDSGEYEGFYFIADLHALTSDYADTSRIKQNTLDMVSDWLAAGLDPERSTIFLQSMVPEHSELHVILSAITPLGWLERVPTYKEQRDNIADKDIGNYAFLGYPVLQAADIIMYKADYVPVGKDQASHVELTREIVRRFNNFFGDVFPEPKELHTEVPVLPGTDGRKMSKSYGNAIYLVDPEEVVREKARISLPPMDGLMPALKKGAKTFVEAGGEDAYFGDPTAATAEDGETSFETLSEILTLSVMEHLGSKA